MHLTFLEAALAKGATDSCDGIISDVRRYLHPWPCHEDRMQKPKLMHLVGMTGVCECVWSYIKEIYCKCYCRPDFNEPLLERIGRTSFAPIIIT